MKKRELLVMFFMFLMLFFGIFAEEGLRCRTGTIEKLEVYKESLPKNFSKVFPELIYDEKSILLKLTFALDTGRKLSLYDYVLKSADGKDKYRCIAVSNNNIFDSEIWEVGPFKDKTKVGMIFLVDRERVDKGEDFLMAFDLPLGYDVPDVKVSMKSVEKQKKETKIADSGGVVVAKKSSTDEVSANFALKERTEKKVEKKVEAVNDADKLSGIVEKISVNPKSFTFYVKSDDGESVKICPYGIVPAEDEKLHASVGKALQSKYIGKKIEVIKTGTDRYGRIVGKMYLDDAYLNRVMIEEGFAFYSWKYAPNDPELQDAKKN